MIKRLARFVRRKWPQPIYELRSELGLPKGENPLFDAKHSPNLVLALFSCELGVEQKDWPEHTLITGFCFYDADAGNAALPEKLENFWLRARRRWCLRWGRRRCWRREISMSSRRRRRCGWGSCGAADWYQTSATGRRGAAGFDLRGGVCAVFGAVSARVAGGAPGRSGDDGAVPARGEADADHALLARPAGQCAADEEAGRGAGDPTASYKPWRVARKVRAMLAEPEFEARARAVAEEVSREDGVKTACDALEELGKQGVGNRE